MRENKVNDSYKITPSLKESMITKAKELGMNKSEFIRAGIAKMLKVKKSN